MAKPTVIQTLRALIGIYVDSIKNASKGLIRNWLILPGSVVLYFVAVISLQITAPLGLVGGFIAGLLQIYILSLYYSWISATINKERLTFKDLTDFDYGLFFALISAAFILSMAKLLVSMLINGAGINSVMLFLQLGIVIIFNAIPEVVYIHRSESFLALKEAARFTSENFIEWFLPLIILALPLVLLSFETLVGILATSEEMMPGLVIVQVWKTLQLVYGQAMEVVGIVLASWFMLFRGYLFKDLESGAKRRRIHAQRG